MVGNVALAVWEVIEESWWEVGDAEWQPSGSVLCLNKDTAEKVLDKMVNDTIVGDDEEMEIRVIKEDNYEMHYPCYTEDEGLGYVRFFIKEREVYE